MQTRQSLCSRWQSLSSRSESPAPAYRRARSEGAAMEETVAKLVDVIGHLLDTQAGAQLGRPNRRRSSQRSERPSVARSTDAELIDAYALDDRYYGYEEEDQPPCAAAAPQQQAAKARRQQQQPWPPGSGIDCGAWKPALPDASGASCRGRGASSGSIGSGMAADLAAPPLPPSGESWEWPLSRPEKKSRVTMLDKNLLIADCHDLRVELDQLRRRSMGSDTSSLPPRSSRFSR